MNTSLGIETTIISDTDEKMKLVLSYTISNYRMTQFWRVLTQSHPLLAFLYHSQEMWIALVKKQFRAELGFLTQSPTAHGGAHHDGTAW